MGAIKHYALTGTTNSSGALTVTANEVITGMIYAVKWIDGTFANSVGAVLSVTGTPESVDNTLLTLTAANDDAWYILREQAKSNTGAAVSGVFEMPIIAGKPKLVVSSGGDSKTGGAVIYYQTD